MAKVILKGRFGCRKLVDVSLFSDFSQEEYKNIMKMKKAAGGPSEPK